jgi:tetratricopeptide (TPR) repeat protein
MKKFAIIFGLLFFVLHTQAQSQADAQKAMKEAQEKLHQLKSNPQYQQAMQRAKQAMQQVKSDTNIQKQMSETGKQLEDLKKTHPELADIKIPDLNEMKVPDVNQTIQKLDTGLNNGMAMLQHFSDATPKENPSHQAEKLPVLNEVDLKALAQNIIKAGSAVKDIFLRAKLDTMAKRKDLNIAGTGLFYLSLGLSPDASVYLIAKGILLHPTDPYAASGLGVYYRDKNELQRSLQCYFYADNLLPDSLKSPYIYANIGWASFYYGDFNAAEKYFDKALALSSNFQPALEGNANLAYAKGNIKALFQCLAKELEASLASSPRGLGAGGGNNSGPSSGFAATCGGATGMDQESNPSDNHTFDNLGKDDNSPEQDPPPGADVTFPSLFFPVFNIKDVKDIPQALRQYNSAFPKAGAEITAIRKKKGDINAKFYGVSYFDEHGDLMHDRDYTKFSGLHGMISVLFQRRVNQLIKDFNEKTLKPYDNNAITSFKNAQPVIAACRDKKCLCQEYRHLYQDGNSLLASGSESWSKLYDNIIKECRWYLKNDAPIVSRVHDPKCNEVLNLDREDRVRTAILSTYGCWSGIIQPLLPYSGFALASEQCPVYGVKVRLINPPNPFSKKPKHIKEFADPNCKDMDFPIGILGTITENCHYTKFTIGPKIGPFQLGFTYTTNKDWTTGKVKDDIYSKNNDFDHGYGATAGLAYKFDEVVEVDASAGGTVNYNDKGKATGYTGSVEGGAAMDFGVVKLGGKANTTWQMNADGNITGHSNSIGGSASLGGNVPTDENDANQKSSGFGIGGDYNSTSNYDANGNYIGGNNAATISFQQSGTTNGGSANKEAAGQNNLFGMQSNQVIQVVAGAKQATPFTAQ